MSQGAMLDNLQERTERTADALRKAAAESQMFVTADDRISEGNAAALLGYQSASFRNLRTAGGGPDYFNRPLGGFSTSYRLHDIAYWIERSRESTI